MQATLSSPRILEDERLYVQAQQYVDTFLHSYPHCLFSTSEKLLEFIVNPHNISLPVHSFFELSDNRETVDAAISSFLADMPEELKIEAFANKFISHVRSNKLINFLRTCDHKYIDTLELLSVKDHNSGRACTQGHCVFELSFLINGSVEQTVFFKSRGRDEDNLLKQFNGWRNHEHMERNEEVFQYACLLFEYSPMHARYYTDRSDEHVIGFTLSEKASGEQSHTFVRKMLNLPEDCTFQTKLDLVEEAARWHALSDLLGKGDRRIVADASQRPSNYFVSGSEKQISLDSIDHEMLFAPDSLKHYDISRHNLETHLLSLFSGSELEALKEVYVKSYVKAWNQITHSSRCEQLKRKIDAVYGGKSVQAKTFKTNLTHDPRHAIKSLFSLLF